MADEKRVIIRVNIEKVGPQTVNRDLAARYEKWMRFTTKVTQR